MKKLLKTTLLLLLCLAMLLSVAACKGKETKSESSKTESVESTESDTESADETESGGEGEESQTETSGGTANNGDQPNNGGGTNPGVTDKAPKYNTFKTAAGSVMPKIDSVKGKKVTLLAVAYDHFKKGGSAYNYLQNYYGITVEQTEVSGTVMNEKYTQAILSGKPYDLVVDIDGYPNLVAQGMMVPLDNTIDFTLPELAKRKALFDRYEYGGKKYYLPWVTNPYSLIFFNKSMFEDANLDLDGDGKKGDTPESLFAAGKWNLDTFKAAAEKMTKRDGSNNVTQYGLLSRDFHDAKIVYSSGEGLLKTSGSGLVNNLGNVNYSRIYTMYVDMVNKQKIVKRGNEDVYADFDNNKGAMIYAPSFCTSGDYWSTIFAKQNVGIAPIPKDPSSSTYYVPGICIGFFVSKGGLGIGKDGKGTLNKDLLNAFINSAIVSENEKGTKGNKTYEDTREAFVKKWGAKNTKFTNAWYDSYMDSLRKMESTTYFIDPYERVLDINEKMLGVMLGLNGAAPKDFNSTAKQNEGAMNTAIKNLK